MGPRQSEQSRVFTEERVEDLDLDMYEDLAEELEDFIYMARLGCVTQAKEIYNTCLKAHQFHFFPILNTYIEFLLDLEEYDEIRTLLDESAVNRLQRADRALLEKIGDLVKTKQQTTFEKMQLIREEYQAYGSKELKNIIRNFKEASILSDRDELDSRYIYDEEIELAIRTHQASFSSNAVRWDLRRRSLRYSIRPIAWARRIPWEWYKLLKIILPHYQIDKACEILVLFLRSMTTDTGKRRERKLAELDQARKLTYLSALIMLFANLDETGLRRMSVGNEDPAHSLDWIGYMRDTRELFDYFFEGIENAEGLLFEKWQRICLKLGIDIDRPEEFKMFKSLKFKQSQLDVVIPSETADFTISKKEQAGKRQQTQALASLEIPYTLVEFGRKVYDHKNKL